MREKNRKTKSKRNGDNIMTQNITSKNTALNQIAKTFTEKRYRELFKDAIVLDYGCGKGMSCDYCLDVLQAEKWYGYDKYNEPYTSLEIMSEFIREVQANNNENKKNKNSVITVNNVLNVLQNIRDIREIFHFALRMISRLNCTVIFKIYEGNGTGNGKITKKDCYQRNEKTSAYENMLKEFINDTFVHMSVYTELNIVRCGQYIEVSKA